MKYSDMKTKKAQVQFIREKLEKDGGWALRGLIRIFEYQTAEEQEYGVTDQDNGVGFTGVDAEFLTSLAVQYQSKGYLSPKQMVHLHRKMPKYARQLNNIATGA